MFDRLGSFRSHSMSEIRNLVGSHYAFCWQPDTLAYVTDLLYKNKYLCDNIENVGNPGHDWEMCLTKLQVWGRFLAPIIVETIVIVFFKATYNARLAVNPATTYFFKPFRAGMLAFLFAIIHCGIREYQSRVKVVRPFDGKIIQSMYCLCIVPYSHGCTNIDDKYVYTDAPAMVWLQARAKTIDRCKAQAASYAYSQYHDRRYPRTDRANTQPI